MVYTGVRLTVYPTESEPNRVRDLSESLPMASTSKLPFTINSTGTATGLFIFLHGLGDTGHGWSTMFETVRKQHLKYIFPNADSMPVTLNYGMKMPSWFDIKSLDMSGKEDEVGIKKAAESIRALIKKEQEEASIPSNRIILGGFSMGGALALYTGLTHQEQLGGMVVLSSWLPMREKFLQGQEGLSLTNQKCPMFQGHGDSDPVVQTIFGIKTNEILSKYRREAWGNDPETVFKTYKGVGHSSSEEEMVDVAAFIQKHLGSA